MLDLYCANLRIRCPSMTWDGGSRRDRFHDVTTYKRSHIYYLVIALNKVSRRGKDKSYLRLSCNKPAGFTVGTVTFGHKVVYPAVNEK